MVFDETTSTLADGDEIRAAQMIEREMESMREVGCFMDGIRAIIDQSFGATEP